MKIPPFQFAAVPYDAAQHGLTSACDVEPAGTTLLVLRIAVDLGPNRTPAVADLLWYADDPADVTHESVEIELARQASGKGRHAARMRRFLGGAT